MHLITIKDACQMLKCSRQALYERMLEPGFPVGTRLGRHRMLDGDALEAWLRRRLTKGDKLTGHVPGRGKGRPKANRAAQ